MQRRPRSRLALAAMATAVGLIASACSTSPAVDMAQAVAPEPTEAAVATAEPTAMPEPSARPEPTATPTPIPTATPAPTPAPVDTSDAVFVGEGFTVTENDVDRLMRFIEEVHDLEFRSRVNVVVADDIGAEYPIGFDPFPEQDWDLMAQLGLVDPTTSRDEVNQFRLDRVRGVCCLRDRTTTIAVELQSSKLATELITIHELTHALHRQHPELINEREPQVNEFPRPFNAAIEGIASWVTREYLATHSAEAIAAVEPELAIVGPELLLATGVGPARALNFNYATSPDLVAAVVAARGTDGLTDLLMTPPVTGAQTIFPQIYLDGRLPADVAPPDLPAKGTLPRFGRTGAVMLSFAIADEVGEAAAVDLVAGWRGDAYALYNDQGRRCLRAIIEMDSAEQAATLADALDAVVTAEPDAVGAAANVATIIVETCGVA